MRYTLIIVICLQLSACMTADLYEKSVTIPDHEWKSDFRPEFTFAINDTSAIYQVFLVLRHTERYNYTNIWLNVHSLAPGDTLVTSRDEITLATNEKGWLATGMDDVYEHRLPLSLPEFRIKNPGTYRFTIEHLMREDPLQHVMNVGLRIEKK